MIFGIISDWISKSNKLERIWLLAKIEFKLRYYENKLGLLWALVKPLSEITIYYFAFQVILKAEIPNFVSFLLIALILWHFFVESTSGTTSILSTKKYLYEYSNMNKIEIYLSVIASNLIGLFFNLTMFVLYFLLFENGGYISWHIVFFIPILIILVIYALAFSMILSTIYVIAKDILQIWTIVLGIGFWVSPIMFKLEVFREALPGIDYLNPIAGVIINTRNVILYHTFPEWPLFFWNLLYSIFFLLLGIYLLNKIGNKAAEKL